MSRAYLGLGSNMGDKMGHLKDAIAMIENNEKISDVKVSSFYETAPVGYLDQDVFVNIVVELETELAPYDLLAFCQDIEEQLKRKRVIRWGPRTIDVDILLYDEMTNDDEKLIIPHPRMTERAFVIVPLIELNDTLTIDGRAITEINDSLDRDDIKKI